MNVHPAVQLDIDDCIADEAEVRRVVAIELGAPLAEGPDPRGEHAHASIGCEGPVAILRVDDPLTHHSLWRRLPLGDDTTQPRLLALALVELVAASWAEAGDGGTVGTLVEPLLQNGAVPPRSVPTITPSPERAERYAVFTSGGTWFSADSSLLVGPSVRLASSTRQLGWMIDAQFRAGTSSTGAGSLSTDTLALGAAATLHTASGRLRLDAGAGLRGGEVRMAGASATMTERGSSFWAPWYGGFVIGVVTLPVTARIAVTASAEGGHVLAPVTALVDGQPAAAVAGSWLQLDFGFGYSL